MHITASYHLLTHQLAFYIEQAHREAVDLGLAAEDEGLPPIQLVIGTQSKPPPFLRC